MELSSIYMFFGFLFTAYSVIANDSIQTLGTFLASNIKKFKWYYLASFISLILIIVVIYGWIINTGDISFQRLDHKGIPFPETFTIWHAVAPLSLFILTRFGIPVSTTFLIISVFGTGLFIQQVLIKSILGYFIAAITAYLVWTILSKYINELKKPKESNRKKWVFLQWSATAFLWGTWITHDISNIAVYLPRNISIEFLFLFLITLILGIFFIFWRKGGKIQKIVLEKTGTSYIRSATIIDFVYAIILFIFKEINNLPMSTTWVFIGLLAGREIAIMYSLNKTKLKVIFPLVGKDFLKVMIGLVVSLIIAYLVSLT